MAPIICKRTLADWMLSYDFFNMANVNFGPSTISMINGSGGLVNPSQASLATMENSLMADICHGTLSTCLQLDIAV